MARKQLDFEQTVTELIRAGIPSWVARQLSFQILSTSILSWGNEEISDVVTDYLSPYVDPQAQADLSPVSLGVPRSGILRRLRITHTVPNGNGNNIVYTVRVNGSPTTIAVTIASTAQTGEFSAVEVMVSNGDLVDIEVTKAIGIGVSPQDIVATLEFI